MVKVNVKWSTREQDNFKTDEKSMNEQAPGAYRCLQTLWLGQKILLLLYRS